MTQKAEAVACFIGPKIIGNILFSTRKNGVLATATLTKMPPGPHGMHIHKGGDQRQGCTSVCDHWHVGKVGAKHGGSPDAKGDRHTGDLGNVEIKRGSPDAHYEYFMRDVKIADILGRSVVIHEGEDDLGLGGHEESHTTGNSGGRLACAIIGRTASCTAGAKKKATTRKIQLSDFFTKGTK